MYALESNIPVAPKKYAPRPNRKCWRYPFHTMEIGDSFFIAPDRYGELPRVAQAAGAWGKPKGRKFTTRTVDGGIRVWRIK